MEGWSRYLRMGRIRPEYTRNKTRWELGETRTFFPSIGRKNGSPLWFNGERNTNLSVSEF